MIKKKLFNIINIDQIPEGDKGIYYIWSDHICLYVGMAQKQGVGERLRGHYMRGHNQYLLLWLKSSVRKFYNYEVVSDVNLIPKIEKERIKRYSPLCNIQSNF